MKNSFMEEETFNHEMEVDFVIYLGSQITGFISTVAVGVIM